MENKEKKLIGIISIVAVLIIVIILIIINMVNDKILNVEDDNIIQDTIVNNEPIDKLNTYFIFDLEKEINSLFINIANKNLSKVLNVLNSNYINENNIDENNLLEKLNISYSEFLIQEVYSSENETNGKFYIYGLGKNLKKEILEEIYFILDVDYENFTYEIYPITSNIYLEAKKGNQEEVKTKTIRKNNDNNITITDKTTEDLIQKYLYDYKSKIIYDIEKSYECLDDEIKEGKLKTIDLYKKYIKDNKKIKEITGIKSYNKQIKGEYIEYSVIDENGISYIINAKELMNYKIKIK